MFRHVFPPAFDNTYRGHWAALILLGVFLVVRLVQTGMTFFDPVFVIQSADGIRFDTFGPEAQAAAINMIQVIALLNLAVCAIAAIALLRYRSMVPLVFLMFFALLGGQRLLALLSTAERDPAANGPMIATAMTLAMAVGFGLSIWTRKAAK
jgi:hypothetical protein